MYVILSIYSIHESIFAEAIDTNCYSRFGICHRRFMNHLRDFAKKPGEIFPTSRHGRVALYILIGMVQ